MIFFDVRCSCPSKENSKKPKYLGDIRADIAATGRYHCQNCNETYEIVTDGNGRVFRRIVNRAKLIAVHCEACETKYKRTFFLGNFQRDIVNQGRFHCKSCNQTYQYNSDVNGAVTVAPIKEKILYSGHFTVIGD